MLDASLFARLRRTMRTKLWVLPAIASFVSVVMAGAALWIGRSYPGAIEHDISEDSLVVILSIFASSMLSVATFTLSAIMASASSASASTTHRASRQVLSDATAQVVLSAFIAAFIYSFVAIIALKVFTYGPLGRLLLFAGLTVLVIFVLVSFINWVDHAMKLGRQSTNIAKLADAATQSITSDTVGTFGAECWNGDVPADSAAIFAPGTGYVSALDVAAVNDAAERASCRVILATRPGEFTEPTKPIAYVVPKVALNDDANERLRSVILAAVQTDGARIEDHDVRFNVVNLAETADRALSPAAHDPGTAIYILNVLLGVLVRWVEERQSERVRQARFERVSIPPLTADELVRDAFTPIARDGAGSVEVGVRLQKVLGALTRLGDSDLTHAAVEMSETAAELAAVALVAKAHKALVQKEAEAVAQGVARGSAGAPQALPTRVGRVSA